MKRFLMALVLVAASAAAQSGLEKAKAEPNLERRSQIALDYAEQALKQARDAYNKGDMNSFKSLLLQVQDSVEFAASSLNQTGKNPRKSPKWFKKAEIATRDLIRRITSFEQEMSVTDRPAAESVKSKIQQIHDDLLDGLMEGRKK